VRPIDEHNPAAVSESQRLRVELMEVRSRLLERAGHDQLIGSGPEHRRTLEQLAAAASTSAPLLIVGEPGTGKRLLARLAHQHGPRRHAPLIPLDCAALPPDVLERELFGPPINGSAAADPPRTIFPEGSTLLIGDVIELPRDLQSRIVSSLDGRTRLIATTTVDPDLALSTERFRADFYYALTALVIRLRPLRDRLSELNLLAQHFLERANLRGGRQRHGFSREALDTLAAYDWPGNLRELSRVIDDAHVRGDHDTVEAEDIPAAIRGQFGGAYIPPPLPPAASLDDLLTQVERRLIENALQRSRHNKSKAAENLGISRPRLYRRIKELNIPELPEPGDDLAPTANHDRESS
jgi:DNA-binding NtrC family response regulator